MIKTLMAHRAGTVLLTLSFICAPVSSQTPPSSFYQNIDLANNLADLYEWLAPYVTEASARRGAATVLSGHLKTAGKSLRWGGQSFAVVGVTMKKAGPTIPAIPWGEPIYYGTGSHPAYAIAENEALGSIRPPIGDLFVFSEESSFYIIATLEKPSDLASESVKFGVVRHPFATELRESARQLAADSALVKGILDVKQDQVIRHAMLHAQRTAKNEVQRARILDTKIQIEGQRQKVLDLAKELQAAIAAVQKADAFLANLRLFQGVLSGSAFLGRLYNEFGDVPRTELNAVEPTEESVTVFVNNYKAKQKGIQVESSLKISVERSELQNRLQDARSILKDKDAPIDIIELFSN